MGLFDTIYFKCPKCDQTLFEQSKSGPCCLDDYWNDSVPVDVAIGVNRHGPIVCHKCNSLWKFGGVPQEVIRVALEIKRADYLGDFDYETTQKNKD